MLGTGRVRACELLHREVNVAAVGEAVPGVETLTLTAPVGEEALCEEQVAAEMVVHYQRGGTALARAGFSKDRSGTSTGSHLSMDQQARSADSSVKVDTSNWSDRALACASG